MNEMIFTVIGVAMVFLVVGYCMGRAGIDKPVSFQLPEPPQDTVAEQPAAQYFDSMIYKDKPKMKKAI